MPYCSHCGNGVNEKAVVCIHCGCAISTNNIPTTKTKDKTQTSSILGVIGIICAWLFALAGHITSVIGIVLGIKEYKETEKITGLVLSIIGEVCSIFSSIIGAVAMSNMF